MPHKFSFRSKKLKKLNIASRVFIISLALFLPIPQTFAAIDNETLKFYAKNNILYYDPTGTSKNTLCNPSSSGVVYGNTIEEILWSGLRSQGLSPEQTAGLMANLKHESVIPVGQEESYNSAREKGLTWRDSRGNHPYSIEDNPGSDAKHNSSFGLYKTGKQYAGVGTFAGVTSYSLKESYFNILTKHGIDVPYYFYNDAYKTWGKYNYFTQTDSFKKALEDVGRGNDFNTLYAAALEFLNYWIHDSHYPVNGGSTYIEYSMNNNGIEGARSNGSYYAAKYEICVGCQAGGSEYIARGNEAAGYYQDYLNGKFDEVENIIKGSLSSPSSSTTTPTDNSNSPASTSSDTSGKTVTIIGDSITYMTLGGPGDNRELQTTGTGSFSEDLDGKGGSLKDAEIFAKGSKTFNTNSSAGGKGGLQIIQENKTSLRQNVIIALGTNQANLTDKDIDEIVAEIGSNHNIFFVTNYDANPNIKEGLKRGYEQNNAAFKGAASRYNNVSVIDWEAAIKNNWSDYLIDETSSSGGYIVHPTQKGRTLFAQLLYKSIGGLTTNSLCNPVSDPNDAISFLRQYIYDTNKVYNLGVDPTIVNGLTINERLDKITIVSREKIPKKPVTPNSSVVSDWKSRNIINNNQFVSSGSCWVASRYCDQCPALTQWFTTMMTDLKTVGVNGSGHNLVQNIADKNGLAGSITQTPPAGFSIFSRKSGGGGYGHTGVILGQVDEGKWLAIDINGGSEKRNLHQSLAVSYLTKDILDEDGTYYFLPITVPQENLNRLGEQ